MDYVKIRETKHFSTTEEDDPLDNGAWVTITVGFTPESLIIQNMSGDVRLWFRKEAGEYPVPIEADQTYETVLNDSVTFQLMAMEDDQEYKVIARVN